MKTDLHISIAYVMIQSNYRCSYRRALYNLQMKFNQYYIINIINYACDK